MAGIAMLITTTAPCAHSAINRLAAGGRHSAAVKPDGTIWTWGNNEMGQLGIGTTDPSQIPAQVSGLTDVQSVVAGPAVTVALKGDGTVWAWGDNRSGQLGRTTPASSNTPLQVPGLPPIIALAAGDRHLLALDMHGKVWAWGENDHGQIGNVTPGAPAQIAGLSNIKALAAGAVHSLALDGNGTIFAWGDNGNGQLGVTAATVSTTTPLAVGGLSGISAISAGSSHSLALDADGTLWAWGSNNTGQLGNITVPVNTYVPVPVTGLSGITSLAAGGRASLAIGSDGRIWTWGNGYYGQLGIGTTSSQPLPSHVWQQVKVATTAAMGPSHTLILSNDGTISAWGNNYDGQLGDGSTSRRTAPVEATGLTAATALAAGFTHTVARTSDGTIWTWGDNTSGQLGDGTTTRSYLPRPVAGVTGATAVDAGDEFTLALTGNGTVWAWGNNGSGQLGNGSTNANSTPGQVEYLSGVTAIAAGEDHALALTSDGIVWAWGNNDYGQLGDSTTISSTIPYLVYDSNTVYLQDVVAIAAGESFSLALKTDGTVWAWGRNNTGQLGINSTTDHTFPTNVTGLPPIIAIAAGGYHALGIDNTGQVWAWGYNAYGQLGDGSTNSSLVPKLIPTPMPITAISAGFLHSLALGSNGTMYAWGSNTDGALGDNSLISRPTPVTGGIAAAIAITAGGYHSSAIASDGKVWGWGWGGRGQLGEGYDTTLPQIAQLQIPASAAASALPPAIAFGNIDVWSNSLEQTLLISNTGTLPLTVDALTLTGVNPSQFNITTGTCPAPPFTLQPEENCTLRARFNPTTQGNKSATLQIGNTAGSAPFREITLSGTGFIPHYTLSVATTGPGSGQVNVGGTSCNGDCAFSYAMNSAVQLIAAAGSGSQFFNWSGCDTVNGTICTVTMAAARGVTALFIPDQGGNLPIFGITPTTADLGMVATFASSSTQTITINNSGTGTLFVLSSTIDGPASDQFSLHPGSCQSLTPAVAPGGSCDLYITFVPKTIGSKQATLRISGTDPAKPQLTANLSGLAYDPPPVGIISINSGGLLTNTPAVSLALNALDNSGPVAAMRFSNTNTSWSEWEPYDTTKDWTITQLGGDGTKTVFVQFRDDAGNISGSFADSIVLDATAPDTTITESPGALTPANDVTISFSALESATFQCQLDNGPWVVCGSPVTYSDLIDGSHTINIRATDTAGNSELEPASSTFTVDTTPPDSTITAQPATLSNNPNASFTFTSSEPNNLFQCRLDAGSWAHCYGSAVYGSLADGSHTFQVRAIDRAGNIDPTPVTAIWTIDTVAPETTITGSSSNSSFSNVAVAFTSADAASTFECSFDEAAFVNCTSPVSYIGISNGYHTFKVRARDAAGNQDATPAATNWTTGCNAQVVGGACSQTIGDALVATPDGGTVRVKNISTSENVTYNQSKSLTLSGGYGPNFEPAQSTGEMTTIAGLTISSGSLTVENLAIGGVAGPMSSGPQAVTFSSGAQVAIFRAPSGEYQIQGFNMGEAAGIDMTIGYNSAAMTVSEVLHGDLLAGSVTSTYVTPETGIIRFAAIKTRPFGETGTIATINFTLSSGTAEIWLNAVMINNSLGEPIN